MTWLLGNAQIRGARHEQQDSFGFSNMDDPSLVKHGGILGVVADGMGGMANGAVASRVAIQACIKAYEKKLQGESIQQVLHTALCQANRAVCEEAAKADCQGEMGSTIVAAVVHEKKLFWASAGDSRMYLARKGKVLQLTTDHNYARELDEKRRQGEISREAALQDPDREALTSFLGIDPLPEIGQSASPVALMKGDRVMLCTDGVYRTLSPGEIAAVLFKNPQQSCDIIMRVIQEKGLPQQDNATVLVLAADAAHSRTALAGTTVAWKRLLVCAGLLLAGACIAGALCWWNIPWLLIY